MKISRQLSCFIDKSRYKRKCRCSMGYYRKGKGSLVVALKEKMRSNPETQTSAARFIPKLQLKTAPVSAPEVTEQTEVSACCQKCVSQSALGEFDFI